MPKDEKSPTETFVVTHGQVITFDQKTKERKVHEEGAELQLDPYLAQTAYAGKVTPLGVYKAKREAALEADRAREKAEAAGKRDRAKRVHDDVDEVNAATA